MAARPNDTFDFESEKGLLAIAAPSEADIQFIAALGSRLGIEEAWIIDDFKSSEMDNAELNGLEYSYPGARPFQVTPCSHPTDFPSDLGFCPLTLPVPSEARF